MDGAGAGGAKEDFVKFPRTYHIFDTGGVGRDDLICNDKEASVWFKTPLILEEKVDGANLGAGAILLWTSLTGAGISIDENNKIRFQNRGHFVNATYQQQWSQIDAWASTHSAALWELLGSRQFILFGEWCYARHSIHYTRLPDLFLAFDIYDKTAERFVSVAKRNSLLADTGISVIPTVVRGTQSVADLKRLLDSTRSQFYDGPVEGLYARIDKGDFLEMRAKLVRSDFVQSEEMDTHWAKKQLIKNIVTYGA